MRYVKVKDRQTLMDIACINDGRPEAAIDYAFANGISLSDYLQSGDELLVDETVFFDEPVVRELKERNAMPATGDTDDFINNLQLEGIGYWYINLDFVVS